MNYKEILEHIAEKCVGVEVKDKKITPTLGEVSFSYDNVPILANVYRLDDEEEHEKAYDFIFHDLMDAGIRRLKEITDFLNSGPH